MNCQYCGQPLADDMKFCVRCGRPTPLGEEEALAFVESPDTTGPLPRLTEEGDVAEPEAVADEATEEPEVAEDEPAEEVVAVAEEEPADEDAGEGVNDEVAEASVDPEPEPEPAGDSGPAPASPIDSAPVPVTPPVVAVHKSRVPVVIASIFIALVVGCACFVGGLYVAKTGLLAEWGILPEEPAAAPAPVEEPQPEPENSAAADPDATAEDEQDMRGAETSDAVAVAVQEGWEALIAGQFSEEARQAWMETVLSLQPEGVLEAYAALVGIEGDSLLPLYMYDGAPAANEEAIREFLGDDAAAVSVDRAPADKNLLLSLNVYFGDLGQSVAGQVESLTLPMDVSDAFALDLTVAPMADDDRGNDTLSVGEGNVYVAYQYEGRWYLLAPELQRADV